ncbi:MAG: hypothetical protein JWP97_1716 [Labilithrix sp.]|nr:hypothetical protein [Labilithrix sp.]
MATRRLLLIDDSASAIGPTKRMLEAAGFEVHGVLASDPALEALVLRGWDVVLTEWFPAASAIISTARNRGNSGGSLVVVATSKAVASTIDAAFLSGADDFIAKPACREELLARLRQPLRMRVKAENPAIATYTKLACWTTFAETARVCLRDTFSREFEAIAPTDQAFDPKHASTLTLSLPSATTELRLAVQLEARAIETIATALMGECNEAIVADIIKEMANAVGGAFMQVGLTESVTMTTSLPAEIDVPGSVQFIDRSEVKTSCWVRDRESGSLIALHLGVRASPNCVVTVGALREGMVLAQDILTSAGALLLKAGTRITSSSSERVAKILGADVAVEVAGLAA